MAYWWTASRSRPPWRRRNLSAIGIQLTPELVARYFTGRRPADMFAEIEQATGRPLPHHFAMTVAAATLLRLRADLRATPHVHHALSWLRGPKCVASSSSLDRVRVSLEVTDLLRYFEPNLFSASEVAARQAEARSVPARGRQGRRQRRPTAS